MKKGDLIIAGALVAIFLPFVLSSIAFDQYQSVNQDYPYLMSFIKFFILASIGEIMGFRIKTGGYALKGFGIIPRAVVWGFLGISIKMAFVIFGAGAPVMLETMGLNYGLDDPASILERNFIREGSGLQLVTAFVVSTTLNLFFAPVFMTIHKITDTHIASHKGKLSALWSPISMGKIISDMDWKVQWNFVFKKTIPFFWIPAQTLNFLLPGEYRVLVAAVYSIILGVILAIAAQMGTKQA